MIKPRLAVLPNRLSAAKPATREEQEAQRLRLRDQNVKWREWYRSTGWQRLRQQVFIRDSYICQQTGIICMGKHPADDSPVAHHKIPHRGDEALFWEITNIETVSKAWHDGPGQAEERRSEAGWR